MSADKCADLRLSWQTNLYAQPAVGHILRTHFTAIEPHDASGDRKPEAGAAGVAIPGFGDAIERFEDALELGFRHTGSAVFDRDQRFAALAFERHPDR